jgi:hypothetical protein
VLKYVPLRTLFDGIRASSKIVYDLPVMDAECGFTFVPQFVAVSSPSVSELRRISCTHGVFVAKNPSPEKEGEEASIKRNEPFNKQVELEGIVYTVGRAGSQTQPTTGFRYAFEKPIRDLVTLTKTRFFTTVLV